MAFGWDGRVRVIGHRGSPFEAPENTLRSFAAAVRAGAGAIELDARFSADGVVVVHHDAELGRIIEGEGSVSAWSAQELTRRGVPTLAAVLDALPASVLVDVELKPDLEDAEALPHAVVDVVTRAGALDRVLATSFEPALASAYAEKTGRPGGFIAFFPLEPEDVEAWPLLRHVLLARDALDARNVEALKACGRVVHAWTVNDEEAARALLAMGVSGIITDRPELARVLERRGDAAR